MASDLFNKIYSKKLLSDFKAKVEAGTLQPKAPRTTTTAPKTTTTTTTSKTTTTTSSSKPRTSTTTTSSRKTTSATDRIKELSSTIKGTLEDIGVTVPTKPKTTTPSKTTPKVSTTPKPTISDITSKDFMITKLKQDLGIDTSSLPSKVKTTSTVVTTPKPIKSIIAEDRIRQLSERVKGTLDDIGITIPKKTQIKKYKTGGLKYEQTFPFVRKDFVGPVAPITTKVTYKNFDISNLPTTVQKDIGKGFYTESEIKNILSGKDTSKKETLPIFRLAHTLKNSIGSTSRVTQDVTDAVGKMIEQKDVQLQPNEQVEVKWIDKDGNLKTVKIKAKALETFEDKNSGRILTVERGGTIIYSSPTNEEIGDVSKSMYRKDYLETGAIPISFLSQIEVPEMVSDLGLTSKFRTKVYEEYLDLEKDVDFDNMIQERIKEIPVEDAISFAKKYYKFGEDEKSYGDLKKEIGETSANIALLQSVGGERKPEEIIKTKEWKDIAGSVEQQYDWLINIGDFKALGLPKRTGDPKIVGMIDTEALAIQTRDMGLLDVSSLSVYDFEQAHKNVAKKVVEGGDFTGKWFEKLPARTRGIKSMQEGIISTVTYPITFSQMGVKYITGTGDFTDVFGRIGTGKTVLLPDIAEGIAKSKVTPVQGLIGGSIGEGISRATTGEGSGFAESAWKYPFETGAATAGELLGLKAASMSIGAAKAPVISGLGKIRAGTMSLTGWNLPGYTSFIKYSPTNIFRTFKWKTLQKLGKAREVSPEIVFKTSALPNQLSFAPGSTVSKRIESLVKAFEKSKGTTVFGEEFYTGVHATTSPWYKPLSWLKKGRESPGVSFAPFGEGSPHFLRIGGSPGLYSKIPSGWSLFPKIQMRTAPMLHFKDLLRIPKHRLYDASKYIQEKGAGVYIAPKMYFGGGEYEVIAHGLARRLGTRYFTRIEGITVPMPEFAMTGFSPGKAFLGATKEFISPYEYTGVTSTSLINPAHVASFFSTPSINIKPFSSSFKPVSYSGISGYQPSYSVSYKPYKPSYKTIEPSYGISKSYFSSSDSYISEPYRPYESSGGKKASSGYEINSPTVDYSYNYSMSVPPYKPSYPKYTYQPSYSFQKSSTSSVLPIRPKEVKRRMVEFKTRKQVSKKYKEKQYSIPFVWEVPKEMKRKPIVKSSKKMEYPSFETFDFWKEPKEKIEVIKKKKGEIDPFIRF